MAVFELDTYVVNAGKLDALLARFRDHTMRLFERHGIRNIGYWLSEKEDVDEPDVLVYLLAHPDHGRRPHFRT